MKVVFIAALGITVSATAALAGVRELAIRNAVQVAVMSKICTRLHLDELRYMAMMKVGDIDVDRDRGDLAAEMSVQVSQWKGMDVSKVCDTALQLYGPKGVIVPNLLSDN